MTQNDPTDNALAAIASILDHSSDRIDTRDFGKEAETETKTEKPSDLAAPAAAVEHSEPAVEQPAPAVTSPLVDVDHYMKLGPGPLDAIRFRWTARRDDDGQYFVDETIGPHSRPLVLGPIPRDEVIAFIDNREHEARIRFDALKQEMTVGKRVPDYDSDDHE